MAVVVGDGTLAQLAEFGLLNWRGPRKATQAGYERGRKPSAGIHLRTPEGHSVYGASAIGRLVPPT